MERQKAEAEKNAYLKEQRDKPRYRVGKQPMWRSMKKSVKKKKAKKAIDPEKLAFLTYLGHIEGDEAFTENRQ